jgi:deoxyguanosine kinase
MPPQIVSIEGNIGAGKTTIIKRIEELLQTSENKKILVLKEPVDIWSTFMDPTDNKNILQKFYENPNQYSFPFQILAFTTRLMEIKQTMEKYDDYDIILCERSLEADSNIFAKMLYDDGYIDSICYQIYLKIFAEMASAYKLNKIFYLNVEPEICLERIQGRGREGEQGISLDYLNKCKKYHDLWFSMNNLPYEIINTSSPDTIYDFFSEKIIQK